MSNMFNLFLLFIFWNSAYTDPDSPRLTLSSSKKAKFPFKSCEYKYPLQLTFHNLTKSHRKGFIITIQLKTQNVSRLGNNSTFEDVLDWYYQKGGVDRCNHFKPSGNSQSHLISGPGGSVLDTLVWQKNVRFVPERESGSESVSVYLDSLLRLALKFLFLIIFSIYLYLASFWCSYQS